MRNLKIVLLRPKNNFAFFANQIAKLFKLVYLPNHLTIFCNHWAIIWVFVCYCHFRGGLCYMFQKGASCQALLGHYVFYVTIKVGSRAQRGVVPIDLLILTRYPTSIIITSKKCAEIKMKPLHWRRPEIIKLRH